MSEEVKTGWTIVGDWRSGKLSLNEVEYIGSGTGKQVRIPGSSDEFEYSSLTVYDNEREPLIKIRDRIQSLYEEYSIGLELFNAAIAKLEVG